MQTRLENFFSIEINQNDKNKKCFIYDPDNFKAFFENIPNEDDTYLTSKAGIKLYYREPKKTKRILLPKIQTNANIPLLKSNLQKAIRRCQTLTAVNSALALIQQDHIEFLRRLPIIYIEDVCLMDSYSIPVWLMMSEKEHKLDLIDIDILLNIVKNLCECNTYINIEHAVDFIKPFKLTHKHLKDFENKDQILSIFYRSQYGGLKGDMLMLKKSIYYYSDRPSEIQQTTYNSIDYENFNPNLEIIPEAIDFHPFPQIITILAKQTNLDNDDIKTALWFTESGLNIRDPSSIEVSREYSENKIWKIIKPKLARIRYNLIQ